MSRLVITPVDTGVPAVILTSAGAATIRLKEGPQAITGFFGSEVPITFEFERFTRQKLQDLVAIAVPQPFLIGPQRNAAGTVEAQTMGGGKLSKLDWDELYRTTGVLTSFSDHGIIVIPEPSVRGTTERMRIIFYPVDRLYDSNGNQESAP